MKRFVYSSAFLLALLLGLVIARMARSDQPVTDPVTECDPSLGDPQCICDPYNTESCYILSLAATYPDLAWPATARMHVTEVQFTDDSPWGFSTGTYRSSGAPCSDPVAVPATGCATNGFYHWGTLAGTPTEYVQFWMRGPAYDANGAPIFGTFDDRLLITVGIKSTSCVDFSCRFGPSEIEMDVQGVSFLNGVGMQSGFYNFNTEGYLFDMTVSLSAEPRFQGTYGWMKPQSGAAVFHYSTAFGYPLGARIKAEPAYSEILVFNASAYFSPWLTLDALDPENIVPARHNLPEPGVNLSLAVSVACLAGAVALGRRKG